MGEYGVLAEYLRNNLSPPWILRGHEKINSPFWDVEAPGWQGTKTLGIYAYFEFLQRRHTESLDGQNVKLFLSGPNY